MNKIINESDVEQKIIYKLLKTPSPEGLGFLDEDILTKPDIRVLTIDKGKSQKRYHPDYAIISNGLPSLIIEAKSPNENLSDAEREARLYASELNAQFPSKVNPCKWFLVSNGNETKLFSWDSNKEIVTLSFDELNCLSPKMETLIKTISKQQVLIHTEGLKLNVLGNPTFYKPTQMLGGKSIINQTVGENTFGANVSLEYKYLFNPQEEEDREAIVKNAYVGSKRREAHISPIDKIIRAAIPRSETDATPVKASKSPVEISNQLSNIPKIRKEICLLIGSVGSGKSTFTDFLRIEGLPKAVRESTAWLNINLNKAPLNKNDIYTWVVEKLISQIKIDNKKIDYDNIETLEKVYKKQIDLFQKGRGSLLGIGTEKYNEELYKELSKLQNDKETTLSSLIEFSYTNKRKTPIIALDNCDKRNRDDQLLMFEVATWLKDNFECVIFLPLRDTTYDQYCNEPPLDTVIKDLVFRVDPPLLEKVVYSRLKYAVREIENRPNKFHYFLSNGSRVECEKSEIITYINSIVTSLFQDQYFRRIIAGLSGRNIRKGLEIFLDFCKSGHISEELIFKIRQSNGEYKIPPHLIAKIMLKGNRQYYSDQKSHVKNVFHSENTDSFNDPLVRIGILQWLKNEFRSFGPSNIKGFHSVGNLIKDLQKLGHSSKVIYREIQTLLEAGCLISEAQGQDISERDLICITPSGFVHLGLIKNINYLSTVSEDTWFRENQPASEISKNLSGSGTFPKDSRQAAISNSQILVKYIKSYYDNFFIDGSRISEDPTKSDFYTINELSEYVENKCLEDKRFTQVNFLKDLYPSGTEVMGRIVSIQNYGFFVEFDEEGSGLIHKSNINLPYQEALNSLEEGQWIIAKIIEYNAEHERFKLELVDF